jgi:hypothetical protein
VAASGQHSASPEQLWPKVREHVGAAQAVVGPQARVPSARRAQQLFEQSALRVQRAAQSWPTPA